MSKKPSKLFIGAVVVAVLAAGYCVVNDVISATDIYINSDDNVISRISESGEKVYTAFSDLGNAVSNEAEKFSADSFLENIEEGFESIENTENNDNSFSSERDKGTVVRIVDGDTYVLSINGEETKVRLIGVDTPESVAPESYYKENSEEGAKVSEIVKEYIKEGDTLYIEYDVGRTDTYGRTLAYLYFESGVMVQEWLLTNGYAQVMTIQPNSKYADRFAEVEQQAMNNGIGLWNYSEN